MPHAEANVPNPPRLPTKDRAFSTGCVFWFALIGLGLTLFALSDIRPWRDAFWVDVVRELDQATGSESSQSTTYERVAIGNQVYQLEIVKSEAARQRGLSGRPSLPANTGMRFVFDTPDRYTFWMDNMRFPIDMVFLSDGVIVNIANNVPYPKTSNETPAVVRPLQTFNEVLELPAGDADKLGLKIGQKPLH